jgi:enterochelin esterase-like enzyme
VPRRRLAVFAALLSLACSAPRASTSAPTTSKLPAQPMSGFQVDPGTEGDGSFPQPEPYERPAEALARRSGVPAGNLSAPAIYTSRAVYPGLKFEYWIYVPAQYQPGKPAALMVLQDGSHYVGVTEAKFNSHLVFDNLIAAGDMPVTIGLFVNPGSRSESGVYQYPAETKLRSMQYDTPSAEFSRFLLEEIIPDLITTRYDIVPDADGWAIGGHSSGGICALMAAFHRSDKFHKVLTHNASFPNTSGVFPAALEHESSRPLRIYLLSSPNDIEGWLAGNDAAAQALAAKSYHYRYRVGSGAHYPPLQAEADYPSALRWLWRGYSLPHYAR